MNLNVRLKKVEERTREMANCFCLVSKAASDACNEYLAARGVVHQSESPHIVTRACPICRREWQHDLTPLDEDERAALHQLWGWWDFAWSAWHASGCRRLPEASDEIKTLQQWLWRRVLEADERVNGPHYREAALYGLRRAKEIFPEAAEYLDDRISERERESK